MDETARLAARTLLASFDGAELPDWARTRLTQGLGGICLYGSNVPDRGTIALLDNAIHAAAPDAITALDEEGGDVTRLYYQVGSPHAGHAALGQADDLALTERVARDIAGELVVAGVDLDLGPVADVNSNPLNPVIGVRSFGADPALAARHTATWVRGLQDAGAGACLKHFPGHGDTVADSHIALPIVDAPLEVLRDRELVPFRAGIEAGAVAVMTSHVVVPALDAGQPATFSPAATHLLRAPADEGGLGFDGLLVSDALDMRGASGEIGVPAAAVAALTAGVDLLCLGPAFTDEMVQAVVDAIVAAVGSGDLPQDRLAEAARRVTETSERLARLRSNATDLEQIDTADDSASDSADDSASDQAATLALHVVGPLPACAGGQVVRFVTEGNQAAGRAPWGLPLDGDVLAGRPMMDVHEGGPLPDLDAMRPVVALVRGGHRHPWVEDALARLVAMRPDTVVVELGWPGPTPIAAGTVIHTFGASAVSARAVDRLLARGRE